MCVTKRALIERGFASSNKAKQLGSQDSFRLAERMVASRGKLGGYWR
jgi:hypothetical protein